MAYTTTKTGINVGGSSTDQIKFSTLRSIFFQTELDETISGTSTVKASDLFRNTSLPSTGRLNTDTIKVPDATENANIVTSASNWRVSHFQQSVKWYKIIQTGTNDNSANTSAPAVDIEDLGWNGNLTKNVGKFFLVGGLIGSVSQIHPAASFNASSYNFRIVVRNGGGIRGSGGLRGTGTTSLTGKGGNGGTALFVNSSTGTVIVNVADTLSDIRGGGGGGARGGDGWTGPDKVCYSYRQYTGGGTGYCEGCRDCPCPNSPTTVNGVTYNSRNCRNVSGCPGERGCACAFGWYNGFICRRTKLRDRQCGVDDPIRTSGCAGGSGGRGGLGRGYQQEPEKYGGSLPTYGQSNGPTGGTGPNCPTCATRGEDGQLGGDGGEWGQSGESTTRTGPGNNYVSPASGYNGAVGGDPGNSIAGSNYLATGQTDRMLGPK